MIKINNMMPISGLVILVIIICADAMKSLLPCDLRRMIKYNLGFKHLIAYLTLLIFVEVAELAEEKENFKSIILTSLILYLWFILTTKMYMPFFIIVYLIFALIYIMHLYEKRSSELNNSEKENIDKIRKILYIISIILTFLGVIFYYKIKMKEYNKNFDLIKFIFGSIKCKCLC
jgi:hypothetical protein